MSRLSILALHGVMWSLLIGVAFGLGVPGSMGVAQLVAQTTFQNRTFVVLQTPDGPVAINVEIGLRTDDRVEIISGVNEGDIIEAP
jgi:hypothetical protein